MSDFDTERKFSTPLEWQNSIDWDDAPDGSEGGYDRRGNFIIPEAMKELVILRARVEKLERVERERDALQARVERLEKALRGIEVFPITHPDNQDAHNLVLIARAAFAADGENNGRD